MNSKALVPVEQTKVDFYGDDILAVVVDDGRIFLPVRPICEFLGANWSAQRQRIMRDPVLSEEVEIVVVTTTKRGNPNVLALPLDMIHGWLFGINANRVKPEIRDLLLRYQRECYRVLANHFRQGPLVTNDGIARLSHVRAVGLAVAQLAEEQMEFEQKTEGRFSKVELRLTTVEERVAPGEAVTEEQASQISQAVKAVAMELSKQSGRNEYGGVYGELYRKFGITSYKLLSANRFQEAMDFLTQWHQSLVGEEPF
jgi:hypothetical protein